MEGAEYQRQIETKLKEMQTKYPLNLYENVKFSSTGEKKAENRFFFASLVSGSPIVAIEIEHQTEIIINGVFCCCCFVVAARKVCPPNKKTPELSRLH